MAAAQPHTVGSRADALDVIVVGAGFAGLYLIHKLRGLGFRVRAYEQGADVGGTWYWNRYPGARCDVESMQYSYSFDEDLQQTWDWSERYAPQPEILRYANHVADRFDLRCDIIFDTAVTKAAFDARSGRWTVTTATGDTATAQHLVLATGCLSNARTPQFRGLADFAGEVYHTAHWPREAVDFSGRSVGLIGTGSSAIQSIPLIAEQAEQLTVFQRTANFTVPARNAPLSDDERRAFRDDYAEIRRRAREEFRNGIVQPVPDRGALDDPTDVRRANYEARWTSGGLTFMGVYNNLLLDARANDTAADFIRGKIAEIVRDPHTARLLQPDSHPVGTKRICVDTDYYATFNRPNVTLVDVRAHPIECILPHGVRAGGQTYEVDALVLATGFDAMTGSLAKIDIRGRGGETLNDKWADGPRTYLGLMTAGFPNMFLVTGPGSPSVLSNMMVSIEQHVEWIAECVAYMRDRSVTTMEATHPAEDRWTAHVDEAAAGTLYPQASSWYMGANIPGKPQRFMPYCGGVGVYRRICNEVAANDYEGFAMTVGARRESAAV